MQKGKSLELANYEFSTVVRWILTRCDWNGLDVTGTDILYIV